ncbi:hypothetical protein [Clostridium botulinum]|uniref:hypothetical protein n=1 Tax=Clostridium botulinum TaxID=1491 RepID=UPI001967B0E6|nr:hypothetical protein [Clostridium botulinum]MBN1050301.1 hypothetical protein [Clostridium botulinum]
MIKNFFVKLGTSTALEFIGMSYWICLFICMIALILYVAGEKKAGKYVSISFAINFLLQALKLGLK